MTDEQRKAVEGAIAQTANVAQGAEAFPYQKTFNAIAAATSISGGHVAISVAKFVEAFGAASPAQTALTDLHDENAGLRARLDEVHSWAVCAAIASPADMAQNFPRIVEITSPEYKGEPQ